MRSQRTVVAMPAVKLALDVAKQDADVSNILVELDTKSRVEVSMSDRRDDVKVLPGAQIGYG